MCRNSEIKEFLPGYGRQELSPAQVMLVEEHLAGCEDCRSELVLLQMMSAEAVPDPGPDFWAEMPGRIEREVRQQKTKVHILREFLSRFSLPELFWIPAAAAASIVLITWLALRPLPVMNGPQISSNDPDYAEPVDPVNMAELTPAQLAAASQWVQNQLAPIGDALSEEEVNHMDRDGFDYVSDLTREELARLEKLLRERERKMKKEMHQKQRNDKNIG